MKEYWFRKRRGEAGQGYGIANRKGGVAVAVFAVIVNIIVISTALIASTSSHPGIIILLGILLFLLSIFGLISLIRKNSDWDG
jgi:protein-S-isoprenylcysteine O-methyltransferase Ste14